MPIPLFFLIAGVATAAYASWNSDVLGEKFDKFLKGAVTPYRKILDECIEKNSDERKIFLLAVKQRMSESEWLLLESCANGLAREDFKYAEILMEISFINQ